MKATFYDLNTTFVAKADDESPRNSEASVIELKDGRVIIAFSRWHNNDGCTGDVAPSAIVLMDSFDKGKTWVNLRTVADVEGGNINHICASFLRQNDGSIALFFIRRIYNFSNNTQKTNLYKTVSYDECATWGEEVMLYEDKPYYPINDAVKRLSDGSVIFPIDAVEGNQVIFTLKTDENFTDPIKSNTLYAPMRGLMEACVAERYDGVLNMVMRTQLGSVFVSESYDKGLTWTKAQATGLRAPESCPMIASIPNTNAQIVVWNNSEYDMHWASHYGKRTPLTAAISCDGLKTFSDFFDIETDPKCVFTNPALTITNDGTFVLSYWTTEYDENWIMGGPISLKVATFKVKIEE